MANLVTITVKANGDDAKAEMSSVAAEARSLGSESPTIRIKVDGATEAVAESVAVKDAVNKVDSAGKDAAGSGGGLAALSGSAMPALIGAGVALSPVLVTLGTGLGGLGIAAMGTVGPIIQASQAAGGLQANMSSLNPVQQQMAQQLMGLKGEASDFAKSLQPEVVKIWGDALGTAGSILHDIQPVAAATGGALDGVVNAIGTDLKTSEWQNFFQFMAQNAAPDMQLVSNLFISLINDLPPLLEGLQPVANEFLVLADGAAKAVGALANMPSKINQVSASNDSLLSKASDFLNWVSSKIPDGNRSVVSLAESWLSSGNAANKGSQQMVQATQAVITPASQLADAMSTAASNTTALDTAWGLLVGNFNSEQQAIVAAKTAVENYGKAVQQSGSGSLAAQGQFYAAVQSMQQMTDAEVKNHAPAAQIYADLQNQINALKVKGPLNSAEKKDLAGLQAAADAAATSTSGLTSAQKEAASYIENGLLPQIVALHTNGTTLNTDMKDLATSILNTGTHSAASASARAALITDLEKSGVSASTAKGDVDNFQKSISSLHGKTVKVGADTGQATSAVAAFKAYLATLPAEVATTINTYDITHTTPYAPPPGAAGPGHAYGGIVGASRGGFTLVGEHGPELVRIPTGSTVFSNPDSQQMAASGGGGGFHITLELGSSFREAGLTDQQLRDIRYTVKRHGGNVQTALGVH